MLATLPCDNDALPSPTAAASPAAVPLVVFPAAAPAQPMGPPAARVRGGRVNAEGKNEGKTQGNTPAKQATVMHDEDEEQGKALLDDEGGTLQDCTLAYEAQADDTNHSSDAATLAYDAADTSASDGANGGGGTLPYDTAPVEAAGKVAARRRGAPARGKGAKMQAREGREAVEAREARHAVEGTMPLNAHQCSRMRINAHSTVCRMHIIRHCYTALMCIVRHCNAHYTALCRRMRMRVMARQAVEVMVCRIEPIEPMVCRQHYPMFQRRLLPMARQVLRHM